MILINNLGLKDVGLSFDQNLVCFQQVYLEGAFGLTESACLCPEGSCLLMTAELSSSRVNGGAWS